MRPAHFPLLLLGIWIAPRADLRFHPEAGSELAKSFQTTASIALDDLLVNVDGQDIDPAMILGGMDLDSLSAEGSMTFRVLDAYRKVGDGRPLELLRSFESASASYTTGMGTSGTDEKDDGLVGRKVLFRWNDESESYDKSWEEGEGPDDEIAKLSEDMDLRELLPASDEETWTLRWREHTNLIMPGFDLSSAFEDIGSAEDAPPPEVLQALQEGLEGSFADAEIDCTRKGEREVDGRQCAVVELASEANGSVNLSSIIGSIAQDVPEGIEFSRFDLELELEVAGELLWDIEAGHFHSLELGGDFTLTLAVEVDVPEEMGGSSVEMSAEASGELQRKVWIE